MAGRRSMVGEKGGRSKDYKGIGGHFQEWLIGLSPSWLTWCFHGCVYVRTNQTRFYSPYLFHLPSFAIMSSIFVLTLCKPSILVNKKWVCKYNNVCWCFCAHMCAHIFLYNGDVDRYGCWWLCTCSWNFMPVIWLETL